MNNDPNNSSLPSWFAESPTPSPINNPTPAKQSTPKKRHTRLIIGIVLVVTLIGGIVGYIAYTNYQRNLAFTTFEEAYFGAQSAFANFSSITEPDDLSASQSPADAWKDYMAAIDTLKSTPIYHDHSQLIDTIRTQSLPFTAYAEQVMPSMLTYLVSCYNSGDITMINATCRALVQTAANANDALTKSFSNELLVVIDSAAKSTSLTETQTDAIYSLLLKIFAAGASIQDTIQPKVAELRQALGLPALNTNGD